MHKLGAEFDRKGSQRIVHGEDSPAHTPCCFETDDIVLSRRQLCRSGKSGNSSSDCHDITIDIPHVELASLPQNSGTLSENDNFAKIVAGEEEFYGFVAVEKFLDSPIVEELPAIRPTPGLK